MSDEFLAQMTFSQTEGLSQSLVLPSTAASLQLNPQLSHKKYLKSLVKRVKESLDKITLDH